jgi:aerotaxis receptor
MRKNLPVTNVEYPLDENTMIMSKTDLKGKLTYFNDQFVAASGFADQELMGQPHNIVRHPDMPSEAFEDLWVTLKARQAVDRSGKEPAQERRLLLGAGNRHSGLGERPSVRIHVDPYHAAGRPAQGVRARYALIREKKAHRYNVAAGIIRRRSFADHLSLFNGTLKARLITVVASLAAFTDPASCRSGPSLPKGFNR